MTVTHLKLVPDSEVLQAVEFESDDPAVQGEMTITCTLADAGGRYPTTLRVAKQWESGA